jgi:flagellar hook protein FlgE
MTFDSTGKLTAQTTASSSASFANGATPNQAIQFDFTGSTQEANPSAVGTVNIDGHGSGSLTDIKIDPDGKVTGVFDNGQQTVVAQLGLATFQNDNGLVRQGDGLWAQGAQSGQPALDVPGQGGRGSVQQGALEESNVDLSSELVTMIQYQRAFEASSKTVTTADEMMQTITNLTR